MVWEPFVGHFFQNCDFLNLRCIRLGSFTFFLLIRGHMTSLIFFATPAIAAFISAKIFHEKKRELYKKLS